MIRKEALAVKVFLDQFGLISFLKTSGGKGLHGWYMSSRRPIGTQPGLLAGCGVALNVLRAATTGPFALRRRGWPGATGHGRRVPRWARSFSLQ
jgi:hypothetical protein